MSQIKEEQLKKLQELVQKTQNGQIAIGQLEAQKHEILHDLFLVKDEFTKFQQELEADYGKISINIQDGTYTEIKEDESNTQN